MYRETGKKFSLVSDKSLRITLKPAYLRFNYLYFPASHTSFFPPGEPTTTRPIELITTAGSYQAQLQYNSASRV